MGFTDIHKRILIVLVLLITAGISHAEMTTSQIAEKYSPSVVTIVALDENDQPLSLGSGFFINTEGDIATNHHVLEGSTDAIIKTIEGEKGNIIEIIKDDPDVDLLIAKTSFKNTVPLPLGDSDTITTGEDIVAIGNPAGLEGTISKGIVSSIRKTDSLSFIQITAPISPGSSGGPVFNLSGKVIGIATAYLDYGQSLNFAMPINYLKNLKSSKMNLASLPKKLEGKTVKKDDSLVQIFDVHYYYYGTILHSLNFGIKNLSNYAVKNVQLFFIYRNTKREVISYSTEKIKDSILPQLALQFSQSHFVTDFRDFRDGKYIDGTVEIRILDYDIDKTSAAPADLLFK